MPASLSTYYLQISKFGLRHRQRFDHFGFEHHGNSKLRLLNDAALDMKKGPPAFAEGPSKRRQLWRLRFIDHPTDARIARIPKQTGDAPWLFRH
jgi:hypothetical protein